MTQTERFVRRNRVDERVAVAIAIVAGFIAALARTQPTGNAVVDAVLVVAFVAAPVWAAASAPWWVPSLACGVGAVVAFNAPLAVVAMAGFVVGLVVGLRQRDQSAMRAVVAGIALNVLVRSDLGGFLGLSALVGITIAVLLFVLGLRRRPSAIRRVGWIGVGAVGGFVVLTLLALVAVGASSRSDLSNAASQAQRGVDALNAGDYAGAASLFARSSTAFARADERLTGALARPSMLVPVVAQNLTAATDLSAAAAAATDDAATALGDIDPSTLQVVEGAISVEAIRAVEAPLRQVEAALADLRAVSVRLDSPWLLEPVTDQLDELDGRLDRNEPQLATAIEAVRLAPQLLGADGPRRYLVLFTTPAEARGLAGFIGNYAEITIDDGSLDVTEFGRRSDLDDHLLDNPASCDGCPQELLDRYGDFGFDTGPNGGVIPTVWLNLTMPAHFPYVAQAAQILYPQSGGAPIDGVISVDPYVIQALMGYTGPIEIPDLGVTVTPENAAQFILEDQYVLADSDQAERIDALQTLGEEVIERLLSGALPEPSQLARDLGPLALEHRLLAWTDSAEEQQLLADTGLLGALPPLTPDGGFSVVVANAGESKIDAFLHREVDLRTETGQDGRRELVAEVTLRNDAPATGLPTYVIGNSFGLPSGSSRLIVNFFGPFGLVSVTADGRPIAVEPIPEAGWFGYSTDVLLGPGDSVDYELRFVLDSTAGSDPELWFQPLARRDQ